VQTDDVVRTYPEYNEGRVDFDKGVYRVKEYPLLGSGGLFLKKAYTLGWHDRRKEWISNKKRNVSS